MRKLKFLPIVLMLFLIGCATTNLEPIEFTAQRSYKEAQEAYLNTWNSYHKVWLALPETDPRKVKWVKKYHPKFVAAGELLRTWGNNPSDATAESAFDAAMEAAENILIELAIKKGGSP